MYVYVSMEYNYPLICFFCNSHVHVFFVMYMLDSVMLQLWFNPGAYCMSVKLQETRQRASATKNCAHVERLFCSSFHALTG
jgi:hypothetical protein